MMYLLPHLRNLSAAAVALFASVTGARAAIIYSGLEDITIPTGFTGIYLDIDTGATSSTAFAGWDLNPFFGGAGVANSAAFQPVRDGTGNLDRILNLEGGTLISGSLTYSSGFGGSGNPGNEHLGPGADQFQPGSEGYLGFRFTTNGNAGPYYGWMRVVFTANTASALVKDWTYETSGGPISTGNILQSAPVSGVQTFTLSGQAGETYTLGNSLADNANTTALVKGGEGTWTLNGSHSFTGATTVNEGVLDLGLSGRLTHTESVTVNAGGTLLLGAVTGDDQVSNSAAITLAGGTIARGANEGLDEDLGTLTLSASSIIDFGDSLETQRLRFQASAAQSWSGTLSVWNWTSGVDHLHFGTNNSGLTSGQLSQIRFYSDSGQTEIGAGFSPYFTGPGEVVPVPEPSSTLLALGLMALAAARETLRTRG